MSKNRATILQKSIRTIDFFAKVLVSKTNCKYYIRCNIISAQALFCLIIGQILDYLIKKTRYVSSFLRIEFYKNILKDLIRSCCKEMSL